MSACRQAALSATSYQRLAVRHSQCNLTKFRLGSHMVRRFGENRRRRCPREKVFQGRLRVGGRRVWISVPFAEKRGRVGRKPTRLSKEKSKQVVFERITLNRGAVNPCDEGICRGGSGASTIKPGHLTMWLYITTITARQWTGHCHCRVKKEPLQTRVGPGICI
jgi:hypothetical protein